MAEEVAPDTFPSQTDPKVALEQLPERAGPINTFLQQPLVGSGLTIINRALGIFLRQREASIAVVAVVLIFYFWTNNEDFLSKENIAVLGQYTGPVAIIVAGEVMLLICGEIDLSVGNVFALAPFLMYRAFDEYGIPLTLSIILAL